MKQANEITEELRSMGSILADLPRTMPYSVPAGYFNDLAGSVRSVIDPLNTDEQTPGWSKKMPFDVPANYFSELPGDIIAEGIARELPKTNPFSVPQGYFSALPQQILQAAKAADTAQQSKTIPLKRGGGILRSLRWAAAAVAILGIGLGSYQVFFNHTKTDPENILSSVPGSEIEDYVQHIYRIDGDRVASSNEINNIQVDNKDIIEYLDETGWD